MGLGCSLLLGAQMLIRVFAAVAMVGLVTFFLPPAAMADGENISASIRNEEWVVDPCNANTATGIENENTSLSRGGRAAPLIGMMSCMVQVDITTDGTKNQDLAKSVSQLVVEKLTNAGIKAVVYSKAVSKDPLIYLNATIGATAGVTSVSVYQEVKPERAVSHPFVIVTWERDRDVSGSVQLVVNKLIESVDLLTADWLAANPRPPAK